MVGRDDEIKTIKGYFKEIKCLALTGKPGIGKTSVAVKFAQENLDSFKIVWQIDAESDCSLIAGLITLALKLGLKSKSPQYLLKDLSSKLNSSQESILIILDNAKNPRQAYEYFTQNENIKVLAIGTSDTWENKIEIKEIFLESSMRILGIHLGDKQTREEAKSLANSVKNLPIAIELSARALLQDSSLRSNDLIMYLQDQNLEYKMKRLISLHLSKIGSHTRSALEILSVTCSGKIPEYMIRSIIMKEFVEDCWWDARGMLVNSGIVSTQGRYWNIHEIVHEFIKETYILQQRENIIDYYFNEFVVEDTLQITTDQIQKIVDLYIHAEKFMSSTEIS